MHAGVSGATIARADRLPDRTEWPPHEHHSTAWPTHARDRAPPQGHSFVGGATKLYGAALRGVTPHPDLLPKVLAIDAGAAPSAALTGLLIVLGVAVVPVLPSMAP